MATQSESQKLLSSNLSKQLFSADMPEQFVRTLPAESLYLAVKQNGLSSSHDILEIATIEQCRVMLDLDLWEKFSFHEEAIWEWLSVTDAEEGLQFLQKLIRCIDLKIIGLMLTRHVQFVTFEEPTDKPPENGFYTPDNGFTWISIQIEDSTRHFLLGRLLALLFETDADLFYQLLALSQNITQSELEEEGFQDKTKRLLAEGIPDAERAHSINQPLPDHELNALLNSEEKRLLVTDILPVQPLIYDTGVLRPLSDLVSHFAHQEEIEAELTLILNAAIVHWGVPFYEFDQVQKLTEKVKGAMNIGLEVALDRSKHDSLELYKRLGLQALYRIGLAQLDLLRKEALSQKRQSESRDDFEEKFKVALELCSSPFPGIPEFLKLHGKIDNKGAPETHLATGAQAIETVAELAHVREFLKSAACS